MKGQVKNKVHKEKTKSEKRRMRAKERREPQNNTRHHRKEKSVRGREDITLSRT